LYGTNTKWCTTQEKYWNEYIKHSKLIYIINRSTNEKYAISSKKNSKTEVQGWLSNDDEISPMLLDLPMGVLMAINGEIRKKETNIELMNVGVKKEPKLKVVKRRKISDLPTNTVMGIPDDYLSYVQNLLEENIGNYGVDNITELFKQSQGSNDDWQ
jgi:hypothetical protein